MKKSGRRIGLSNRNGTDEQRGIQYVIIRQGKKFQIFEQTKDEYLCIIESDEFHKYSNSLMDIFGVKMPCISNRGI